ncbi:hypothetical protein CCACVL1_17130 [Corchorus capsularis]|uniref:Uncharacterized protein n=1 Tax=Corchorus capsularis TaxID=210143 RepID=A0A1R3HUH0_COCAP|nr:hypothetical protein CCACVL1_17130 [Corchorus capsularis]
MAAPARTSSSSIPCRTNPNLKRSEISDPMRRSFSGNPFSKPSIVTNPRSFNPSTPANSPSDFPRRHSTGRESIASLRDSDKENSKDQNPKPTRVRSPAPSKVTKNFMSPTISAASKMNASPRKKILAEKNDPVRSSVSFSDVRGLTMEDNESTPEIALKKKKKLILAGSLKIFSTGCMLEPAKETDAGTAIFDEKYYGEIEAEEAVDEDDHEQEDQEDEAYENVEQVSEEEPDEVEQGGEAMIELDHLEAEENKGVEGIEPVIELDHLEAEEKKGVEAAIEGEAMIELDHLEAEENKGVELVVAQFDAEHQNEGVELAAQSDAEHQSNVNYNDQPSIIPQATENQPDVSKSAEPEGNDLNQIAEEVLSKEAESDNPKIEASTDSYLTSEAVTAATSRPEDQFLTKNTMAFSLLVLCLLAAIAFIYTRREKSSMPKAAAVTVEQPILAKKSEYSLGSVGSKDTNIERLSSRNRQTVVDMANDSCPSEMSSCHKTSSSSSSYSKKVLKESNSYQSQETKSRKTYRRESLASSDQSMGSASYGSFTTYEKLPSKHGGGDEEIVTPVRRSSRIRKQVTSP